MGEDASNGGRTARSGQARRAQGAVQRVLHDELVLGNLSLADRVAAAYTGAGRDMADLRQVAYLGLVKAVQGFDAAIGVPFPAYAAPTIHGELKRYLRDHSWVIRPPRHLQDLRPVIARTAPALAQRLGREATVQEIADELGHERSVVAEALTCHSCLYPVSLDSGQSGDGREDGQEDGQLADSIGLEDGRLGRSEDLIMLRAVITGLSMKEKELLFRRYFREQTQQAIGADLGMTQMQVSRMLARTLVKLQTHLLTEPPVDEGANRVRATRSARSA